jgi:hypothetical protein
MILIDLFAVDLTVLIDLLAVDLTRVGDPDPDWIRIL